MRPLYVAGVGKVQPLGQTPSFVDWKTTMPFCLDTGYACFPDAVV